MGQNINCLCCQEQPPMMEIVESSQGRDKLRTRPNPNKLLQNGSLKIESCSEKIVFQDIESTDLQNLQAKEKGQASASSSKTPKTFGFENFTIAYLIGSGHFSQVFLGCVKGTLNDKNARLFAIKQMKKSGIHSKKLGKNINLQKKIMKEANSNFITRLYFSFQDDHYYYLGMEWAEEGDVYSFIKPGSRRKDIFRHIGEPAIRFILACVILGLEALHSQNIIYYDLKPENMLVFKDGYVKLTDFGLSQEIGKRSNSWKMIGTPMYNSPQMVLCEEHGKNVDLWALGVVAYELSNFFLPFDLDDIKDKDKFIKKVKISEKKRKWCNNDLSFDLRDLIDSLLKLNPESRIGAMDLKQIKNHSFFTKHQFDWQALNRKEMKSPLLPIFQCQLTYKKVDESKIRPQYSNTLKVYEESFINDWSDICEQHN